jgi:amino acid transporter
LATRVIVGEYVGLLLGELVVGNSVGWLLGELVAIVAAVVVVVMAGAVATLVVVVVVVSVAAVVVVVVLAVFVPHSPLMSNAHPCLSQHSHTVKERCDFSSAGVILATAVISFLGPLRQ